jgi:hypothetical protein
MHTPTAEEAQRARRDLQQAQAYWRAKQQELKKAEENLRRVLSETDHLLQHGTAYGVSDQDRQDGCPLCREDAAEAESLTAGTGAYDRGTGPCPVGAPGDFPDAYDRGPVPGITVVGHTLTPRSRPIAPYTTCSRCGMRADAHRFIQPDDWLNAVLDRRLLIPDTSPPEEANHDFVPTMLKSRPGKCCFCDLPKSQHRFGPHRFRPGGNYPADAVTCMDCDLPRNQGAHYP